jgi:pyruvate dehydrogenase E1 component alpha subunit
MPRKAIKIPDHIEYISVLDEHGRLDTKLMPDLTEDQLRHLHRIMLLSRRFDERLLTLQRQGRIGTFAPIKGQEAVQIGAVAPLQQEDWVVPSFRETAAAIYRGIPLAGLFIFQAGYNEGGRIPEGQHTLPIAVPVGTQIPHAVGIAYGMKYRQQPQVSLVFFGDGATSQGDFHEGLNFAGVLNTPTIFLCQNNHWAISVPRWKQTKSQTLAQKALAYGIPGIQVDGNDVFALYLAVQEAVERARAGKGPTLIECVTYRLSLHTTADDPTKYRSEEEVREWEKRDPLVRLQKYLIDRKLLSHKHLKDLEADVQAEIDRAWQEAQEQMASMGDPLDIFDYVYAELPPYLAEQRQAFQQFLASQKEGGTLNCAPSAHAVAGNEPQSGPPPTQSRKDTHHARINDDSSAQLGPQTGNGQRR